MKIRLTCFILLFLPTALLGQIRNLEDENNLLRVFAGLVKVTLVERFPNNNGPEGGRQQLRLDLETMSLVYEKTPYKSEHDSLKPEDIPWLARFILPVLQIDSVVGDSINGTLTFTMKNDAYAIEAFHLIPGNEYGPAGQDHKLTIYSENNTNISPIAELLHGFVQELQHFHEKKMELVNYLNQGLETHLDSGITIIQPFQIGTDNQLSMILQKGDIVENQTVLLTDIRYMTKESLLVNKAGNVVLKLYFPASEKELKKLFGQIGIVLK